MFPILDDEKNRVENVNAVIKHIQDKKNTAFPHFYRRTFEAVATGEVDPGDYPEMVNAAIIVMALTGIQAGSRENVGDIDKATSVQLLLNIYRNEASTVKDLTENFRYPMKLEQVDHDLQVRYSQEEVARILSLLFQGMQALDMKFSK